MGDGAPRVWKYEGNMSLENADMIGETIREIPVNAFKGCIDLKTIGNVPATVVALREYCCQGATCLHTVDLHLCTGIEKFCERCFAGTYALRELDLSSCLRLTSIGSFAFHQSGLVKIELPSSVSEIGIHAFGECCALCEAQLEETQIRLLPKYCFYRYSALETVTLPPCLEAVGDNAFEGCGRLPRIDLGQTKVRALPARCFRSCSALAVVVFPPKTDSIGQAAFYECKALERLEFPVTLTLIEDNYAFCYTALTEADFRYCPKLTRVGHYAFASCTALRDVYFGAGLRSCGDCAFRNCPSLTALDFRPCVKLVEIGEQPFRDCLRLREIRFGSVLPLTGAMFTNVRRWNS
jgi:hypothetical protein